MDAELVFMLGVGFFGNDTFFCEAFESLGDGALGEAHFIGDFGDVGVLDVMDEKEEVNFGRIQLDVSVDYPECTI